MAKVIQDSKFDYYKDKVCPLCLNYANCDKDSFRGYKNMKGNLTVSCPNYILDESRREKQEWKAKK